MVSAVVRSVFAWRHETPRLFPDEYIYAALGRSISHGHLAIRGTTSHFPAILEPILAAPIWRLFSTITAYHLVQVENAVAASFAAVPIYLLARWLGLSRLYSFLCAVYGLLIPSLVLVGFTMSDSVAYPLALSAVTAGLFAIERPTARHQVAFFAFATLATLARVEYFVLVPAYLVAAVVVDRRESFRKHRVALIALAPVAVVVLVAGLGYYSGGIRDTRLNLGYVRWFFTQMFLLTLETGVAAVPGAVAALLSPKGRRETCVATFVGTLAFLLLAESTAHAADSSQFKERYLFALLPLVPIAFGLYLKHGRPRRVLVVALAVVTAIAAARLPVSAYVTGTFKNDSQFLSALGYAQDRVGVGSTSLFVAMVATIGALCAVVVALRRFAAPALVAALAVAAVTSVGATAADLEATRDVRAQFPHNLHWIDDAANGMVTAIAAPESLHSRGDLLTELYWNVSVQREVVLAGGNASDYFAAPPLRIARSGELLNVRGDILFDASGTTARFAEARVVARTPGFSLWRAAVAPRFRLLIEGRWLDHWLNRSGVIKVWPASRSQQGAEISFRLSLPRNWQKTVRANIGGSTFVVHPGSHVDVSCSRASGPLVARFSSRDWTFGPDLRPMVSKLTRIRLDNRKAGAESGRTCVSTR